MKHFAGDRFQLHLGIFLHFEAQLEFNLFLDFLLISCSFVRCTSDCAVNELKKLVVLLFVFDEAFLSLLCNLVNFPSVWGGHSCIVSGRYTFCCPKPKHGKIIRHFH